MSDRVSEDETSLSIVDNGDSVDFWISPKIRTIRVFTVEYWKSSSFDITAEEATALKDFLIRKGY